MASRPKEMKAKPVKRTGYHRLACAEGCGMAVYMTLAMIEKRQFPRCACGGLFHPENPVIAFEYLPADELSRHPAYDTYVTQQGSVNRGQWSMIQKAMQSGGIHFRDSSLVAFERVYAEYHDESKVRKVSGLKRGAGIAEDPIPF